MSDSIGAAVGDELLTVDLLENRQRLFGIRSKNAAYRAAALGQIPAIKLGGKWRVPIRATETMFAELGRLAAGRAERSRLAQAQAE